MSVVVVIKKGRSAAICSDSLTTQGPLRIPGETKVSPRKIHRVGAAYVGITGSSAHHRTFASLIEHHASDLDMTTAKSIFESFRTLHPVLKEEYFILTNEDDEQQEYESNQLFGVVCSPKGIFSFQSYREVTEHETYWASGSGSELALGALHATYPARKGARSLAESAVEAACYFDKDCGLPLESFEVRLQS